MEPTADGLVEVTSDIHTATPVLVEAVVALASNGHDTVAIAEGDFEQHQLLHALQAMRYGDFSVRLPGDMTGIAGKIADTFNEIVAANERMAQQLEHVGQVVGRAGKTRQRLKFDMPSGSWAAL